jgi:hypothetical protein
MVSNACGEPGLPEIGLTPAPVIENPLIPSDHPGTPSLLIGFQEWRLKPPAPWGYLFGDGPGFAIASNFERSSSSLQLSDLKGRTLSLGSRDSGHAAILPVHFLEGEGLVEGRDYRTLRFDSDVGKRVDTGASEVEVVNEVIDDSATPALPAGKEQRKKVP